MVVEPGSRSVGPGVPSLGPTAPPSSPETAAEPLLPSEPRVDPRVLRTDPRVLRTRGLLQQALLDLARERSLDEISVADVAERATVSRSTFYQHYPDTDTLLADALDAQVTRAGADLGEVDPDTPPDQAPAALIRYAEHVAANVDLYRQALGPQGSAAALDRLRRRVEQVAAEGITVHGTSGRFEGMPPDVAAGAVSGAVVGVLGAWLARDPLPPPAVAAVWAWAAVSGWGPSDRG